MNREKVLIVAERMVEYGFFGLIFFLPISKALIETCAGFVILGFLIKKIAGRDFLSFKEDALVFWLLLAFFAFNAMSLINSGPLLGKGIKTLFSKWVEYFFIFVIAVDHFKDPKTIRRFFYVLAFSAMLSGMSALTQKFFGFEFIRQRVMMANLTGPFENQNSLSAYLVICLPIFIVFLFWKEREKVLRILVSLACILLMVVMLLTFSRSGWLGFFMGLIVMAFVSSKKKLLLSILGIFVASLFVFFPFTQRVVSSFRTGGDSERFIIWRESLEMIQQNPFLGKGLGTYMDYSKKDIINDVGSHYAHNCYLQMWAEAGIFTLIAFLCLAGFVFLRGARVAFKNRASDLGILLCGLTAGLFGFLVASFFDTQLYSLQLSVLFWVMMGVTVALTRVLLKNEGRQIVL